MAFSSPMKTVVCPRERHTAGALKSSPPPGSASVWTSPPSVWCEEGPWPSKRESESTRMHPVLAADEHAILAEQGGRARAQIAVAGVQLGLIGGRELLAQPQRGHGQLEHAVTEVAGAVPRAVAGVDQQAAARRARSPRPRARGSPSRSRAAARHDQGAAVRAEGVVDGRDATARFVRSAPRGPGRGGCRRSSRSSRRRGGPVDVQRRAELLVEWGPCVTLTGHAAPLTSAPSESESLWISPLGEVV